MTNAGLIRADTEFVLANDIDLSAYSSGEGWTPIGNTVNLFAAKFNGNRHVISNLYINRSGENYQGLFGYTDTGSEITNLGLKNINVTGNTFTGGLVGRARSEISNCYASGKVEGYNNVGGLIGYSYGTVTDCFAEGSVEGIENIGGFIGVCDASAKNVKNCYSIGKVTGGNSAGGFAGYLTGTVTNCYSLSNVEGGQLLGGFAGNAANAVLNKCISTGTVTASTTTNIGDFIGNRGSNLTISADSGSRPQETPSPFVFTPKANGFLDSTANIGTGAGSHNTTESIKISELITIVHKTPVYDTNIVSDIVFQVGINSSNEAQICINTAFLLDNIDELRNIGKNEGNYLETIDNILTSISAKQTEYGACQNRLESVLEEINVHYENLISSRSTLRDSDISKESSAYISNFTASISNTSCNCQSNTVDCTSIIVMPIIFCTNPVLL